MATNIGQLPLCIITVETGTNEDWIDGLAYFADDAQTIPLDLAGISFRMEMRHLVGDHAAVLELSTENGGIIALGNTIQLNVRDERMAIIPPTSYVFDIVAEAEGIERITVRGSADVFEGVTRE